MSEYKVLPEWDGYITDEDRVNPTDVTFSEVIEVFEKLITEKLAVISGSPETENQVDAYVYWHINLMGLRDLHERYHHLAEFADEIQARALNGDFE